MTRLSRTTLADLEGVPVPAYDRGAVTVGIVHIGVGGFHRAHQAMYVDRLLAAGATRWGICGVGTQPLDRRMGEVLRAQDHLYTLVEKHPDGRLEPRVVGSLVDYLYAPDDPEAVVERLAAPDTHVVSLTITKGGYQVDPLTGIFAASEPAVLLDACGDGPPRTVFGLVTAALERRRSRGTAPFTVLSCDNVQRNGDVAREAFSGFATLRDPELGAWVRRAVSFPCSMVDRITPATTEDDRALLASTFGIEDGWPVVCEPYVQWVLEDSFGDGRPPWEDVGVHLVADVHAYEQMKLRLLNAGHQAIGYLGYLAGHRYTDEACADPLLAALLETYLAEAAPTLAQVPGVDVERYRRTLLERFRNPYVRDPLSRLCSEGTDRIPTFLLPVVRDLLATGRDISRSALVVAAWAHFAEGADEQGRPIAVVDRRLETVLAAAGRLRQDPSAFLVETGVFAELATEPRFVEAFSAHVRSLHRHGTRATLHALLDAEGRLG